MFRVENGKMRFSRNCLLQNDLFIYDDSVVVCTIRHVSWIEFICWIIICLNTTFFRIFYFAIYATMWAKRRKKMRCTLLKRQNLHNRFEHFTPSYKININKIHFNLSDKSTECIRYSCHRIPIELSFLRFLNNI